MTDSAQTVRTTINRKWTIKMVVIGLVLVGFGIWGWIDAAVVYPRRGYVAASWLEYQYLDLFSRSRPPLDARAGVADPAAELQRLERTAIDRGSLEPVDKALAEWLDQLSIVGRLDGPSATAIPRTDFRGEQVTDAVQKLLAEQQADSLTDLVRFRTEEGQQFTALIRHDVRGLELRLMAEDGATRSLLGDRLPEVRQALERAGLSAQVSVDRDPSRGSARRPFEPDEELPPAVAPAFRRQDPSSETAGLHLIL
jgi:hypothetical protein